MAEGAALEAARNDWFGERIAHALHAKPEKFKKLMQSYQIAKSDEITIDLVTMFREVPRLVQEDFKDSTLILMTFLAGISSPIFSEEDDVEPVKVREMIYFFAMKSPWNRF